MEPFLDRCQDRCQDSYIHLLGIDCTVVIVPQNQYSFKCEKEQMFKVKKFLMTEW